MVMIAFLSAVAYFISYGGNWLIGTCMSERPIVVGAITGILLGDLKLGLMLGASLEVIFMGAVNIGGQLSADPAAATVFAVAFATQQSIDAQAALTLAIPIGVLLGFSSMFVNNIFLTVFVPMMDRFAAEGNEKGLAWHLNFGVWIVKNIFFAAIIFFGVYVGHAAVEQIVNGIPSVVMTGLSVAGKFLPAVGLALLMKMLWSKEVAMYFFLGFILTSYLQLPIIAVAGLGLVLTLAIAQRDLELNKLRQTPQQTSLETNDEEDFFA